MKDGIKLCPFTVSIFNYEEKLKDKFTRKQEDSWKRRNKFCLKGRRGGGGGNYN